MPGAAISEVEVSNISKHGFWLLLDGDELFLPFREFPWFKKATRRSDSPAGAAGAGASLLARSRRRPGRRVDQAPRAIPAQIGPLTSRHRTHRRGVIRAETNSASSGVPARQLLRLRDGSVYVSSNAATSRRRSVSPASHVGTIYGQRAHAIVGGSRSLMVFRGGTISSRRLAGAGLGRRKSWPRLRSWRGGTRSTHVRGSDRAPLRRRCARSRLRHGAREQGAASSPCG